MAFKIHGHLKLQINHLFKTLKLGKIIPNIFKNAILQLQTTKRRNYIILYYYYSIL